MSEKKRKGRQIGKHKLIAVLKELSQNDEACKEACSKYIRCVTLEDGDVEGVLSILASLLLDQNHTLTIADHLTDSLPHILALALSDDPPKTLFLKDVTAKLLHEKRCVALSKLALVHPDVIMFALKYFNDNPSPFHYWNVDADDEPKAKKRRVHTLSSTPSVSCQEIAVCCYTFLQIKTDHFRGLWDWSEFLKGYLNNKDSFVRWLACQCCALLLKMGVQERETLLLSKLTSQEMVEFPVKYYNEVRRIKEQYAKIGFAECPSDVQSTLPQFKNDTVTSVAGIALPLNSKVSCDQKSNLVLVDSTLSNLQAIALGIATGRTLCLQGPVGCGKTALVEYLANLTGRGSPPHYLSVQLGDQTDSKMLLGTYQCTDIPGEFVWKPGVLTQAVVGGYWLLLEDIDSCTTDVAAVLTSLLETGTLCVPGFKDCVYAAPGFQLFFTQRLLTGATGLHKQHTGVTSMLQRHWLTVQMEPLSKSELERIVRTLHPPLSTVAQRIVDVFLLFSAGSHHTALLGNEENSDHHNKSIRIQSAGARLPSTRDLMKWCTRSSEAFDVSSSESALNLFQDAIDIFCCNVSNPETRLSLAESIAAKLGIIHTKATYLCNTHKPIISSTSSHVIAGRIKLPRKDADRAVLGLPTKSTYSFTRPAAALLERIASCIYHNEPVLLVGETGVGKTSSIQYLAQQMGQSMSVINMNQQSDSADLLGGFKPVELKYVISPLRDEFETLFRKFFSVDKNTQFLSNIERCFSSKKWTALVSLMKHSTAAALKQMEKSEVKSKSSRKSQSYETGVRKGWLQLSKKLNKVQEQLKKSQNALAFAFVEGTLVKALQEGQWVLLDEINLASAQTLECLSSLLEGSTGSLYLLERGDENSISRHPNFRIFAAMNPATDVGKKDLPPGIRNRFSEFYVDELVDHQDLMLLSGTYLAPLGLPATKLEALVKFYLKVCREAVNSLSDGTGHKPHYSLRTLCRALTVAASNPCASTPRSLYEGFLLSFLTQLDRSSHPVVEGLVAKAILGKNAANPKSIIKQPIPNPAVPGKSFIEVEGYWVTQGSLEPQSADKYILTKTVRQNLRDLVRVVSLARLPVLLQGETSVGKTSLITYLAQLSGNRCLRINNHEHTDLQEYIGCYAADEHGNLVFKEGVLVEAMRYGHWIILDELNLAPSDVLEALNRVLDDNRELFIPETQIVVKAHPNFMLFATQNPPGFYGGRKVLSRAFRNRFIELHFDEIPGLELETIMHLRCDMPPSYCRKMVAVMTDLQVRRRGSAAFAGKQGFITLRDLFRWGERYRLAQHMGGEKFYDWDQHIADEGYLILAGRVRKDDERVIIQEVLKKHLKRSVNPEKLFSLNNETSPVTRGILEMFLQQTPPGFGHIVWTFNMRRLAVLLGKACQFKEPVLLVGETGCGKTTVCQLLAKIRNQNLASVNCHMHSESADFLGGLRPVREHSEEKKGKLFEWVDGPLIEAMLKGGVFLADEISLADDSVLERLNSLLEPERKLLLAEKGSGLDGQPCEVAATDGFIFVGTMNPGGDYGKKELSPALRNRFTEIWCEGCTQRLDLIAVIEHNLRPELIFNNEQNVSYSVGLALVDFLQWFAQTELGSRLTRSIRDIMTWVEFINVCTAVNVGIDLSNAYIHGACLTFLDSLGTGMTSFSSRETVYSVRVAALEFLRNQIKKATGCEPASLKTYLTLESDEFEVLLTAEKFGMKPFYISRGCSDLVKDTDFLLSAPTTRINAMRVLRGLQLGKALLLEGSPGVGKTSLVAALARSAGYKLTRINLSDQTDISDLFGADLPVEGGSGGEFAWRDGPFLQALRAGHWILLDELNLASQSVLEGLNAVLDHRGDLFIPELGRSFQIQPGRTRLFACQNPLNQGGARKGLPQSFLNRFTQVYMETLTFADLEYICRELYPTLPPDLIKSMVEFNLSAASETAPGGKWGQRGSPWEMNLRDLCRWCEVTVWGCSNGTLNPGRFVHLIYVDRMRTVRDKEEMMALYKLSFTDEYPLVCDLPQLHITPSTLYVGDVSLKRGSNGNVSFSKLVLRHQLSTLQSLARCVSMGWLSILVGPGGCGKTSLVHLLAQLAGQELRTLAVNSAMDTTEILGGFEQADYKRHLDELAVRVEKMMTKGVQHLTLMKKEKESQLLLALWENFLHSTNVMLIDQVKSVESEIKFFSHKIDLLSGVLQAVPDKSVSAEELQEKKSLLGKLSQLQECAVRDSSLNAGGKFEWVDSILIKSLTDGCWLLVDNVNLCSAAVLDRLNGLLEPHGVLTVSERGVNSDGELVTIQPHPNFRLFLTMDPRNGEISRAMRNRGVEIYVTIGEGDMAASLNQLDLAALLYDVGIHSYHDQQLVFNLHQAMVDVIQGPDPPGLTELLHASFLFVQQVQRGMPSVSSLLSSFTKVYIQSRLCDNIDTKRRNLTILEETVQRGALDCSKESVLDKLVSECTLKTGEIYLDSCVAAIKQRSAILCALADSDEIDLYEVLQSLGITDNEVNFPLLLTDLIVFFYQTCSVSDANLAHEWLQKCIEGSSHGDVIGQVSDVLYDSLVHADDLAKCHLLWDRRWLPDVRSAIAALSGMDDQGVENRLSLLLYITAHSLRNKQSVSASSIKKLKSICILEYSHAVSKGTLADTLSSEPVFVEIGPFLDAAFDILSSALNTIGVAVSDDLWWSVRKAYTWTQRFLKQAASLNLSSDKNAAAEALNLLGVHYRWFSKYSRPILIHLASEAALDISSFHETLGRMDESVFTNNSVLWHVAKKLRREIGQPLPIASDLQAMLLMRASSASSALNMWCAESSKEKMGHLLNFLSTSEGLLARASLIVAWRDLFATSDLSRVEERLQQAEKMVSDFGLLTRPSDMEVEVEPVKHQRNLQALLWPFQEAVCLHASNSVLLRLLRGQCQENSSFIQAMKATPSVPAALIGFFEAIEMQKNSQELCQSITWLLKFSNQSLAVLSPQLCTISESNTEDDVNESEGRLPQHCPVVSRLAANLLFYQNPSSKDQLYSSALDQHSDHARLLKSLRALLWQKSGDFCNPHHSYRENETMSVLAAAEHFISSLEKSCYITSNELGTFQERAVTIVEELQLRLGHRASSLSDFYLMLSELVNDLNAIKNYKPSDNETLMLVGLSWALLGCLESQLFSAFPKIDPTVKQAIKCQHVKEEIVATKAELVAAKMIGAVRGVQTDCTPSHPHLSILKTHMASLEKQFGELSHQVAVRPEPPLYSTLTKEMQHFANSLSSSSVVTKLTDRLRSISKMTTVDAQGVIREAQTWLQSIRGFTTMLETRFGLWYPDIVGPLLASSAKLIRGIELMVGMSKKCYLNGPNGPYHSSLSKLVCSLGSFPTLSSDQPSVMSLLSHIANRHSPYIFEQTLRTLVGETPELLERSQMEAFWMLKSALLELKNFMCETQSCKTEEWCALVKIFRSFTLIWEKQEAERREKEEDKESLYKSRGAVRCQTISEEDEALQEMAEIFPSKRENDFGDLEPQSTLDDAAAKPVESANTSTLRVMMNEEDVALVSSVHMSLVLAYTKSPWIDSRANCVASITPDFLSPWLQRCAVAARLISSCSYILNDSVDRSLLPGWILASHLSLPKSELLSSETGTSPEDPSFDFYRSPCISEVKQCKPLLDCLQGRIDEFLIEWPEHPTLNQLSVVIKRIVSFPVESPIARFLTGLEILLTKMREWEENAHKGVSLLRHSTAITHLVIQWRRLELSIWKNCLNAAAHRMQSKASRWWFYIFSLVDSYIHPLPEKENMSEKEIVTSLERFMEEAPLGEYHLRLDMILAFHCHVINLPGSDQQRELLSVLWNLHNFYTQFKEVVANRITELKAPIEKKLKDYVKIARWNDVNYWAVKESVFKTQRVLHKHIKEFESVLRQAAKTTLLSSRVEGQSQKGKKVQLLNPQAYVAKIDEQHFLQNTSEIVANMDQPSIVSRAGSLFSRSKKLTKEIVLSSVYPGLIASLDEFSNQIAASVQEFASMEVDRHLPKSKQKSQAKNQLQVKRKALADLFRVLRQNVGLSHYTGLTYEEVNLKHEFIKLPPIDLCVYLQLLGEATDSAVSNKADKEMLTAWNGCGPFFTRAWARYIHLSVALRSPHRELGPQNIERLRGFPAHLLVLTQDQHRQVFKNSNLLAQMRIHLFQLKSMEEFLGGDVPSQPHLGKWNQRLQSLLVSSSVTLQQFKILLDACPAAYNSDDIEKSISSIIPEGISDGVASLVKGDLTWQKAVDIVDQALSVLTRCRQQVKMHLCDILPNQQPFATAQHFQMISQCYKDISALADSLCKLQDLFGTESSFHPSTHSLIWLKEHMLSECKGFSDMCQGSESSSPSNNCVPSHSDIANKVNSLMQNILLAIQKMYKSHTNFDDPSADQIEDQTEDENAREKEKEDEENEDEVDLQDKHLSDGILKSVETDLQSLSALEISSSLDGLMNDLLTIINEEGKSSITEKSIRTVLHVYPLLQQWLLLYQFVLQQQVAAYRASSKLLSILLAVFGDVAVKGFCTPEDILSEEEAGDGEGDSDIKQDNAMGLGDGEGEKNVSDRIESEDQLEDARPPGEEKKDEEKDCNEEENGIEMSDNFDGKLQDVEPKGDDDEEDNDDDDDDDAEKEMGDTENNADQLDEQIWGSDSEEEGDEGDEKEEEDGNSGEKTGEKELGAREDEKSKGKENSDDHDENGEEGDEQKKEKDKPEINEMEDAEQDDDQIDPYHGNHPPEVEPEPLDLPDDLELDDGEGKDENNEENPFDIDEMKDKLPPEPDEVLEPEDTNEEAKDESEQNQGEGEASDDDDFDAEPKNDNEEGFEEANPEEGEEENLEKSDERKEGEKLEDVEEEEKAEEKEKEEETDKDERTPSKDDPTSQPTQSSEDENKGSMDQVASKPEESEEKSGEQPPEEADNDPGGEEKDAIGQAPTNDELKGHHSDRSGKRPQRDQQQRDVEEEKQQRPGHSDEQRSLGDISEPAKKRLKTVDIKDTEEEEDGPQPEENSEDTEAAADLYQHIKDMKEQSTAQTIDAATKEQAEEQPVIAKEDEEDAPPPDEDVAMEVDNEEDATEDVDGEKQKEEKLGGNKNEKKKEHGKVPPQNEDEAQEAIEVDGETVETLGMSRGPETTFHTRFDDLVLPNVITIAEMEEQSETVRRELENQLAVWNVEQAGEEATQAWQSLSTLTNSLARDLSEQLRLVLEPTQATRMKGDFRTGRRINMRKVIPYIASQFRKDKIWMRRTKPSKREYQIMLAIDDSSSMADNRSKELAFESLALVSQALTLLEAGELSVVSFGEAVKVLHKLGEPFTQHSGARLLQQFTFEQKKTQIGLLVEYANALFSTSKTHTSAEHAQLLVVISDGRGVFSEGQEKVNSCVRKARLAGIFMVFVIIDNPENKSSILDIRTPIFSDGQLLGISSYMDTFPFPFYLILRDIANLPAVLSDALRQWFEIVSSVE